MIIQLWFGFTRCLFLPLWQSLSTLMSHSFSLYFTSPSPPSLSLFSLIRFSFMEQFFALSSSFSSPFVWIERGRAIQCEWCPEVTFKYDFLSLFLVSPLGEREWASFCSILSSHGVQLVTNDSLIRVLFECHFGVFFPSQDSVFPHSTLFPRFPFFLPFPIFTLLSISFIVLLEEKSREKRSVLNIVWLSAHMHVICMDNKCMSRREKIGTENFDFLNGKMGKNGWKEETKVVGKNEQRERVNRKGERRWKEGEHVYHGLILGHFILSWLSKERIIESFSLFKSILFFPSYYSFFSVK